MNETTPNTATNAAQRDTGARTPARTHRRGLRQAAAGAVAAAAGVGLLNGGRPAHAADIVIDGNNVGAGTTALSSSKNGVALQVTTTSGGSGRIGIAARNDDTVPLVATGYPVAVLGLDETADGSGVGTYGGSIFGGIGVQGTTIGGVGVEGETATSGIGVKAKARAAGTALVVEGKATFNSTMTATGIAGRFVGNGSLLTSLNASNLTSGSVNDARLSSNVPLKNAAANAFTGALSAASVAGDGAALTNLAAGNIASGTLPDACLSANVPLKDAASNAFTGALSALSFAGDGAPLTNLRAGNIASGKLPDARLSVRIPRRNLATNAFTGRVRARVFEGPGGSSPRFSSVGRASVSSGADRVLVTTPLATAPANIIVTLQSNPGVGVSLKCIVKAKGSFLVLLTGPAKRRTTVGYFILRHAT